MTERNFIDKHGNSWVWEETPETIEALKQLHEYAKNVNNSSTKFGQNYKGPLYAPHPDLKKPNEYKTTDS